MLQQLFLGLSSLGTLQGILYLVGGSLIGVFIGVVPGLSGIVILSVILSFINHISLTGAICLFLASYASSFYSASITSILLNTPAHPEAFAVTFDGFPMAQRGEAGRALGISAVSTMIGAVIGCIALFGFLQILNGLNSIFHPPELIALILLALLLTGTLGTDAPSKAVISAGLGVMISCIGASSETGIFRYTFNSIGLAEGVSLVALALGLFAIPQMILIFGTGTSIANQDMMGNAVSASAAIKLEKGFGKQIIRGMLETPRHWGTLLTSGLIGSVMGLIPGVGGFTANFLSYGVAQQTSKHRELFGTGIPEGIIAPEGSSISKEATQMVPIIGLGVPGGVGGALFLAALTIKGVRIGYGFQSRYPGLSYEIMWVIGLGGIIGTIIGLLLAPVLARVTRVPGPLIVPVIMVLAIIGAFIAEVQFFSVMEVLAFAIVGLLLRRLRYPLASFAIALVLGSTLESSIYLTREVYHGWGFLSRPLADALLVLCAVLLLVRSRQLRREKQRALLPITAEDPLLRAQETYQRSRQSDPFPLLALIMSTAILALTISYGLYGGLSYGIATSLMPVCASVAAGLAAATRIPRDFLGYMGYRRARTSLQRLEAANTPHSDGPDAITESVYPQHRGRELPKIVENAWGWRGQFTRELCALLWFIGLISVCYVFGFFVGISIFVVAYGLLATRRVLETRLKRVIYTLCSAAILYGLTYEGFNLVHLTFTPIIKF